MAGTTKPVVYYLISSMHDQDLNSIVKFSSNTMLTPDVQPNKLLLDNNASPPTLSADELRMYSTVFNLAYKTINRMPASVKSLIVVIQGNEWIIYGEEINNKSIRRRFRMLTNGTPSYNEKILMLRVANGIGAKTVSF
jgi:hypothetical protein